MDSWIILTLSVDYTEELNYSIRPSYFGDHVFSGTKSSLHSDE